MVNTEDFIKRLEIILDYYGINASAFADKIGVQRSSLSHLLSGRNKPSLDFVLKILDVYPEVDLYWILNGKGSFPKNEQTKTIANKTDSVDNFRESNIPPSLFDSPTIENNPKVQPEKSAAFDKNTYRTSESEIDKIVIFYRDGTFKSYVP
jgi:transcriptional regulator with XRE-family HTH domain